MLDTPRPPAGGDDLASPDGNGGQARGAGARNAVWAVMGQGAGQLLSLLLFLLITRYVSKASFGLVAVSLAAIEFIRRVLIDPFAYVVTAKPEVTERDFDRCFTLLLLISGTAALLTFAGAPLIAGLVGTPSATPTLRVLSPILLAFGLSGTHGAWFVRRLQFRALAIRSILSVVAGGVVGLGMAATGFELWSLVGQQLAIQAVTVVTLWGATRWRPRLTFSWRQTQASFRQASHISMSSIWTSIALDADIFFASAFFGPAVAGVYNAGKRIMLAVNLLLVNTISAVTLPTFANLDRADERGPAFLNGLMIASAITAPAFAGLAVAAPELVGIIFGARWHDVAPILAALATSGYALSVGQFATAVLLVAQRSHLDALSSAAAALLNVAAFFLVLAFGPVALAATVSATAVLILPVRLRFAMRELGVGWGRIVRALLPATAAAALMAAAATEFRTLLPTDLPVLAALISVAALGASVYLLLMRVFAPALFGQALNALRRPRRRLQPEPG